MGSQKKRALRRWRTLVIALRRRTLHLSSIHRDGPVDCACERASTYFSKRHALGCGCSKRRKGAPRRSVGSCDTARYHVYRLRRQALELGRSVRRGECLDGDIVAVLAAGKVRH